MQSQHGDHAIEDVLTSNLQIEIYFSSSDHTTQPPRHKNMLTSNFQIEIRSFPSVVITTSRPLTDKNLIFFSLKPKFLQRRTKKFRHEIVITASHFRRLNFFYHSFFFQNTWKKNFFFKRHLDFLFLISDTQRFYKPYYTQARTASS